MRARRRHAEAPATEPARHTAWTFGELPELMEIRRGAQVLVGFPALIDRGTHVEIEVFDEPALAAAKHRAGLRRLVALQMREPLKYLEKNIPDLQKMAVAYMALGTLEELRDQIIDVALDRAFLAEPLPTDERAFAAPARRRPRPAEPDRAGGGAPGRRGAGRVRRCAAQAEGQPAAAGAWPTTCRRSCSAWSASASCATRRGPRCSTCRAT